MGITLTDTMALQGERDKLLPTPWRKVKEKNPWTEKVYEDLKEEIATYELLKKAKMEHINVLFVGQISAGKTSFFNTVESVFENYVTQRANSGCADESLTTQYSTYEVQASDNDEKPINFKFCDTMGLEGGNNGLMADDVAKIMDGHVMHMADLSQGVRPKMQGYNASPELGDKIHCVAFVVDGSSFDLFDESLMEKFKKIRWEANQRDLNPIIIVTRIDQVCGSTGDDVTNVYHSQKIHEKVKEISEKFGINVNKVYPVKNYSAEVEKELAVDILNLHAQRQILRCSKDFLKNKVQAEKEEWKQLEKKQKELEKRGKPRKTDESEDNFDSDGKSPTSARQKERMQMKSPMKAPPPPPPAYSPRKAVALYDYVATTGDEVTIAEEEEVEHIADLENGWTKIKNHNSVGLVPTNYLKIIAPVAPSVKAPPPPPKKTTCTAVYAYEASAADQIDMKEGEKFSVVQENMEGGWTKVKGTKGKTGKVPAAYLKIDQAKTSAPQAPSPPNTLRNIQAPAPPITKTGNALNSSSDDSSDDSE